MVNWKSYLKSETLDWLLERENPSLRYFTLTDLLDQDLNESKVKEAKLKIMSEGIVSKM